VVEHALVWAATSHGHLQALIARRRSFTADRAHPKGEPREQVGDHSEEQLATLPDAQFGGVAQPALVGDVG
jgi:hypothetical protein